MWQACPVTTQTQARDPGLSAAEVADRIAQGQLNHLPPRSGRTVADIVRANVFTRINAIRKAHPALHWLRNLVFHNADDENVMVFSKRRVIDGREDTILVVANLDPHGTRETMIHLDMPALGMGYSDSFIAQDLLSDAAWQWWEHSFVRLGPDTEPVHIIAVRRF